MTFSGTHVCTVCTGRYAPGTSFGKYLLLANTAFGFLVGIPNCSSKWPPLIVKTYLVANGMEHDPV